MIKNTFAAIGVTVCILATLSQFGLGHFRLLFTQERVACIGIDYE
jgi:hypothetical protein